VSLATLEALSSVCLPQSLTSRHFGKQSGPQPIYELGYNPEDVKARLSGVPVYTVTDKKKDFVLVTGEVGLCSEMHTHPQYCLAYLSGIRS
jgi:Tic22-like family